MRIAAIDSSTTDIAFALAQYKQGELHQIHAEYFQVPTFGAQPTGEQLSCILSDVIQQAGCDLKDITTWAVGLGPGPGRWISSTVTFMKQIAAGSRRPLQAISSLETIALESFHDGAALGAVVVPILGSTRAGQVYAGAYRMKGESLEQPLEVVLADGEYSLADLKTALTRAKKGSRSGTKLMGPSLALNAPNWFGVGSGYNPLRRELQTVLAPLRCTELPPPEEANPFMLAYAAFCRLNAAN